jgi:hypothetical protein
MGLNNPRNTITSGEGALQRASDLLQLAPRSLRASRGNDHRDDLPGYR